MNSSSAIQLLLRYFPEVQKRVDSTEALFTAAPYFAYGLLGTETLDRRQDTVFLERVVQFVNMLADGNDPVLQDALVLSVLERVAEDSELAGRLRKAVNDNARTYLEKIEADLFGRKL